MTTEADLTDWLSRARKRLDDTALAPRLRQIGLVEETGDGVAVVSGLPQTRLDEILRFENGTLGIAFHVEEQRIGCVLLGANEGISAGSKVFATGDVLRVPVGDDLLGRVIDPTGRPMDGQPPPHPVRTDPIERPAPGIVDRDLVTEPLLTGLTVIDAMIPLGRGQRELVIGDRKTGKTTIAIDTMINQRSTEVICVYAAVGQKASNVAKVIETVRTHGAPERCVFVFCPPDAAPGLQWAVPYAACTVAEFFRDRGQDALLIIDDLTKHAIIYRQLSLLLRRPPGREAYPGDVFYLHARLLERAGKLSADLGGGSLTALPIAETQAGNLTAYIPTNLISITDGQIYLEPKLFYEGHKPPVNVAMSVSRVGGKTQAKAIKSIAETLKLDYAQFLELEVFTRFGAMVDERTKARIEHGKRIRAILSQEEFNPLSLAEQVGLLMAVADRKFEDLPLAALVEFKERLGDLLREKCPQAVTRIEETKQLSNDDREAIQIAIDGAVPKAPPQSQQDA